MLYTCQKLNDKGQGVAVAADGKVIFVDDWLVGEVAEIEWVKRASVYHVGRIVKRLNDHPARVKPVCPVFQSCGGCHLQHLAVDAGREWKKEHLNRLLVESGLNPKLYPFPESSAYGYRHKLLLPLRKNKNRLEAGFFSAFSNELVPIASWDEKEKKLTMIGCGVQTPILNRFIERMMALLGQKGIQLPCQEAQKAVEGPCLRYILARQAYAQAQIHVTLIVTSLKGPWRELAESLKEVMHEEGVGLAGVGLIENARADNRYIEGSWKLLLGSAYLEDELLGMRFSYDPLSFFQVNPELAQMMWQQVHQWLKSSQQTHLLELYSGRGLLANWLALQGFEVMGLELDEKAVFQAQSLSRSLFSFNSENHTGRAQFQVVDLAKPYQQSWNLDLEIWSQAAWMVNPPRKGLSESVRVSLARSRPSILIYMACGQAALMSDAKYLKGIGYELKELRPYDLFSQTCHVETLALFVRSS